MGKDSKRQSLTTPEREHRSLPQGYRQGIITAITVLLGFSLALFRFWGFEAPGGRPRKGPSLTFPQVRAFVQEIFTGLLFISRPQYMRWVKQAEQRFHQLRI